MVMSRDGRRHQLAQVVEYALDDPARLQQTMGGDVAKAKARLDSVAEARLRDAAVRLTADEIATWEGRPVSSDLRERLNQDARDLGLRVVGWRTEAAP